MISGTVSTSRLPLRPSKISYNDSSRYSYRVNSNLPLNHTLLLLLVEEKEEKEKEKEMEMEMEMEMEKRERKERREERKQAGLCRGHLVDQPPNWKKHPTKE